MIILDSDVLIKILDRKSDKGAKAVERILNSGEDVCTTVIGLHEGLFGMYKHEKPVKELLQLPALNYVKLMQCSLASLKQRLNKQVIQYNARTQ